MTGNSAASSASRPNRDARRDVKALPIAGLGFLTWLNALAGVGNIILLNGTSSAGKSSLSDVMVAESRARYEVVSFDDFYHAYQAKHQLSRLNSEQHQEFLLGLYHHARAQSELGRNVIIDTVEFDRAYDRYCGILNCSNVVKAVVYCPLQDILKRVERRNNSGDPSNRRAVLLCFQQFVEMYKLQSSPGELVVDKTRTGVLRAALEEAGKKANNPRNYESLHQQYIRAFGIDREREITIVPRGEYDLVLNTRAKTKKENVRLVEEYLRNRGHIP